MLILSETATVSGWESFGLPGLVIGASFLALGVLGRYLMNAMREMRLEHLTERATWQISNTNSQKQTTETLREISHEQTAALREVTTELGKVSDQLANTCKHPPR